MDCPQDDIHLTTKGPVGAQQRQKEFTSYRDYIGMDITSLVSLPVWIMEPFTILQRMAEIMEYTEHLDTAAVTDDQYDRCALLSNMRSMTTWVKGSGDGYSTVYSGDAAICSKTIS